ncbi:plasma membrane protein Pth11-like protein [Hypoxylon sp. NC1633]|nr:plasma membrane protein Pth11-like protein [Hypoxylon sp. NC1633]
MSTNQQYFQSPGPVIAAAVCLPVLDIAALLMRFLTRRKQKQALKADDWFLVPATLITLGLGVSLVYGVAVKALAYPTYIPPEFQGQTLNIMTDQHSTEAKIQWAYTTILPLALGCIKASFLFFYMRIFATDKKNTISILLITMIALVIAWTVAFFFAALFQCGRDFYVHWGSPKDIVTHCVGTTDLGFALCVTDFIMDVLIMAFPIPLIARLNLSLQRKLAIISVFLLGGVTVIASLIRLVETAKLRAVGITPGADAILTVTDYLYWGMIEIGIGVFAACLPTVQSLFRGWSWDPILRSARGVLSSTGSATRFLRTRSSKRTMQADQTAESARNGSLSQSEPSSIKNQARSHSTETYSLENVKAEQMV